MENESHIEELKKLSTYLSELESELSTFWLITPAILCIAYDGKFIKLNPAWELITGYSIERGLATPYKEFVHPDDVDNVKTTERAIDGGKRIKSVVIRYKHALGYWIYLSWSAWQDDFTKKIYATATDVSHAYKTIVNLEEKLNHVQ